MANIVRLALSTWWRARRNTLREFRAAVARRARWPDLVVEEPVTWVTDDLDCIEIGHHVHIGRFSEIVALARSEHSPVEGRLSIGDRTFIGAQANIRATGGIVRIGRDCLLAQQVSLIGCNHEIRAGQLYCDLTWDTSKTGVTIGNNVWVGCGSTVLPGCAIGDNAVVGAGSVVTKSIPAGTIWAGNPARQIRVV